MCGKIHGGLARVPGWGRESGVGNRESGSGLRVRRPESRPRLPTTGSRLPVLTQCWRYNVSERSSSPVQARLHGAQVALGDLGDLLVRFAFELAEDKHLAVVLGELGDRFLDQGAQVALTVEVVRAGAW